MINIIPNINPEKDVIHFIGIGGIGMSGIAIVLHEMGYNVQGSDIVENYITDNLKRRGVKYYIGHNPNNLQNVKLVIFNTVIKSDNVEMVYAKENDIKIAHRSDILSAIMKFKHAISVSGTHGKTTTTAMISEIFSLAKNGTTVINGGMINSQKSNAYYGNGEFAVIEADESDRTFTKLNNYVSVITNINREHLEFYCNDFEVAKKSYESFITNIPFYGFSVICISNINVKEILSNIENKDNIFTYSISDETADIYARNVHHKDGYYIFDIYISKKLDKNIESILGMELKTYGIHNVENSLAAVAVGLRHNISKNSIRHVLKNFSGTKRRFTMTGEASGILVIDDYAHHPVEIDATLKAARNIANDRCGFVISVFEPHKYTRLREHFSKFIECLSLSDISIIADVYAAGESPIENINSDSLQSELSRASNKSYRVSSYDKLLSLVRKLARKNDVVIFLSAGHITKWSYMLPSDLK